MLFHVDLFFSLLPITLFIFKWKANLPVEENRTGNALREIVLLYSYEFMSKFLIVTKKCKPGLKICHCYEKAIRVS